MAAALLAVWVRFTCAATATSAATSAARTSTGRLGATGPAGAGPPHRRSTDAGIQGAQWGHGEEWLDGMGDDMGDNMGLSAPSVLFTLPPEDIQLL